MWADLHHVRGYLQAQRKHAAKEIQAWWRGCVARRRVAALRADYQRFASRFTPAVRKIQRAARCFLNRRRFRARFHELREHTRLKLDVATLKAQMRDMQALVLAMNQQLHGGRASSIGGASSLHSHSHSLPGSRAGSVQPRTEHPTPTPGAHHSSAATAAGPGASAGGSAEKTWRELAAQRRAVDESAITASPLPASASASPGASPEAAEAFGVVHGHEASLDM